MGLALMHFSRIAGTALVAVHLLTSPAFAYETRVAAQISGIADTVTRANDDPHYRALLDGELSGLVHTLKGKVSSPITQAHVSKAKQPSPLADNDWLKGSGYDFAVRSKQTAGIKILGSFVTLPRWQLERSEMMVTEINHLASPAQQEHAIIDAQGDGFLYFIPEALGPRLGKAFLAVYEEGRIGKAAALIKASEISTGTAKAYFKYPRPFLIDGNRITLVRDKYVVEGGAAYVAEGGAFPSGHTNAGYTDAILLAAMLPERFAPLVARAAGYGYSRLVLGVHYPLDVIGSRMIAQRNVAALLNDQTYRKLFDEARDQLRSALEQACGTSIADCARSGSATSDPWSGSSQRDFYDFTMTYSLPQSGRNGVEMQVPEGAEVLLATLLPNASAEERRSLLKRTALESGYPLDSQDHQFGYWQRVNLYWAAVAAQERLRLAS